MLQVQNPVVTPTPEDLDMSTSEQCATPQESMSPEQSEPSFEISPSEDFSRIPLLLWKGLTGELLRLKTLAWTVIQRRRQKQFLKRRQFLHR